MSTQKRNMCVTTKAKGMTPPAPKLKIDNKAANLSHSMIMSTALGYPTLHRLTPPRDLTLGGRGGAPKKVFTPNLNAVRNKNAQVKTAKDTSGRGRGRGRGRTDRGRGRGGAQSVIQTAGLFTEGAGTINIRKTAAHLSHSRNTTDTISSMRRPIIVKTEEKVDVSKEKEHLRDIIGDSDDDDLGIIKTELSVMPIKLEKATQNNIKTETKKEKSENETDAVNDAESAEAIAQHILMLKQKEQENRSLDLYSKYADSLQDLFNPMYQRLFLLQLPGTLPCEDEDGETPEEAMQAAIEAFKKGALSLRPKTKKYSLKTMEEGQVGKLLRYKSGKIKLVLGESHFDLDLAVEPGLRQNVVSINTNRDERSGNMINLGSIQGKLIAAPDWEVLLNRKLVSDDDA